MVHKAKGYTQLKRNLIKFIFFIPEKNKIFNNNIKILKESDIVFMLT